MAVENITYTGDDLNAELMDVLLPVTVFFIILAVFGIFGNASVFLVFKFRYPQCNFRYFVLFLSVVDLVSCLTTIPLEIYSEFNWFDFRSEALCKFKWYMNVATILPESFILLLISIDRYRKVCRPFGGQLSPRQSLKICLGVCIGCVAISFLTLIVWGNQNYIATFRGQEVRGVLCKKVEEYKDTVLPTVLSLIFFIVPCMVNMVVMSILCIFIGKKIFCLKTIHRSRTPFFRKDLKDFVTIDGTPTLPRAEEIATSHLNKIKHNLESGLDREIEEEEKRSKPLTHTVEMGGATSLKSTTEKGELTSMQLKDAKERGKEGDSEHIQNMEKRGEEISGLNTVQPEKHVRFDHRMKNFSSNVMRRTFISFVLTAVFVITMTIYFAMLNFFGKLVLRQSLSPSETRTLFIFFRLYFINSAINPVVYGFLDARFKAALNL